MTERKQKKSDIRMISKNSIFIGVFLLTVLLLCLVIPAQAQSAGEETGTVLTTEEALEKGWVDFYLMCNEGMSNRGGNSGNTSMVVAMNEHTGTIRLMMFAWDTFVE